jgi:6-phosphogluconolactonase
MKLVEFQSQEAGSDLDWSRTELYQVDERYIPHSDSRSNFKLVDETIVSKVGAKLGGFFAFETKLSINDSLDAYEHILSNKIIHGFDLCILGIGPDGHTASLFPHSSALAETTQTDRFDVKDRLSLTFPAIMKSKKILVLLKGADKQTVIDTLQSGKKMVDEFPAMKLLEHDDLTIYFLQ